MTDGVIICYTKCWPCMFGEHQGGRHTWKDPDDLDAEGTAPPKSPEEWDALAAAAPCACWCAKQAADE